MSGCRTSGSAPTPRSRSLSASRRVALVVTALLATAVGAGLRLWLLASQSLTSDQAVTGLMAMQIQHGHFYTFYWGNQYGGGEFYVVALLFWIFGTSAAVLNGTAAVVTAVAAVCLWRAALRLGPRPMPLVAVAMASAFWIWPEAAVWNSTRDFGFRELTALLGCAAIWSTGRMLRGTRTRDAVVVGGLLGLGWWSSPEIAYFAVCVVVALLLAAIAGHRRPWSHYGALGVAFVGGAIPWIWTNLHTGFASLSSGSSPDYLSSSYGGRLHIFFAKTLPMMFGLRVPGTGAWLGGDLGQAGYVVVGLVAVFCCLCGLLAARRNGQELYTGAAAAVLVFPFLYAVFPATSYWFDGHYAVFLIPILLLTLGGTVVNVRSALPSRSTLAVSVRPVVVGVALTAMTLTTVQVFSDQFLAGDLNKLTSRPPAANAVAYAAGSSLADQGVRFGYADYWTAYDVDFLTGNRLVLSDPSADRWVGQYRRVRKAPNPAWIFYSPAAVDAASAAFTAPTPGPFGVTEAQFEGRLQALHVGYRVIHAGVLDAIVTDQRLTQQQVGMGQPYFGS